ncbi:MAG: hypothetical protein QOF76_2197 [Solirubrobacteraceae bacterium]|jgi:uncharacterized membrane protein|nr:hypothetical protein [Solirubrobacteraceae bacterium]
MPKLEGRATAIIEAPIDRCYEVAADPENAGTWQTEIKKSEVLERDDQGQQTLVHNEVDGRIKTLKSTLRFTYDAPTGLQWKQEKGDVSGLDGSWVFKDLGDGRTEATCQMVIDLGRVLGMAARGPVGDVMRKQLIETMPEKLKKYVEANPA